MKNNNFSSITRILFLAVFCFLVGSVYGSEIGLAIGTLGLGYEFIAPRITGVAGLNNTNNLSARASFEQAKLMFWKAFRPNFPQGAGGDQQCKAFVDSLKLSQNEIRVEVNLTTAASNFVFGVTPNQANTTGVVFTTENRLNLQDSLCVNEYGILVGQAAGNTDTAYTLETYGNNQVFAAADAAALNSTFYANGGFQLTCNNDVLIPYRGLFNHYYRGQTQQTAALGAGSPGDQLRGAEDGFITSEPNIVLIGSKNYQPQIVLKAALASAAANLRCVLIFRGILAQNSTVVS